MSDAFKSIIRGLKDVKAHREGKLRLPTNTIEIAPIPQYKSRTVKSIRNKLKLTQVSFASIFGVSKKTVEAWESGKNSPNGTAQRLLWLIKQDDNFLRKENIIIEKMK